MVLTDLNRPDILRTGESAQALSILARKPWNPSRLRLVTDRGTCAGGASSHQAGDLHLCVPPCARQRLAGEGRDQPVLAAIRQAPPRPVDDRRRRRRALQMRTFGPFLSAGPTLSQSPTRRCDRLDRRQLSVGLLCVAPPITLPLPGESQLQTRLGQQPLSRQVHMVKQWHRPGAQWQSGSASDLDIDSVNARPTTATNLAAAEAEPRHSINNMIAFSSITPA